MSLSMNRFGLPEHITAQLGQMFDTLGFHDSLALEKREARKSFGAFMRLMYPNYVDGRHLREIQNRLERVESGEIKRLIITVPPRHSKSLHVSENFPAWFLGRNPDKRVIACSHTAGLAYTFSRRVRNKFEEPNWPFPEVQIAKDKGAVQAWDISGSLTGGYAAVGVGGTPVGLGGDVIIIDDPIRNQADADSPQIRETTWEWFEGAVYTRRQPGAAIIVTATRWHEDDLTGRLLKQSREGGEHWEHLHLPAIDDYGDYLWPEYWSPDEYELARGGADRVWNAQYMGRPTAKGGGVLREEWFPTAPFGERYLHIVQAWDCASKPGISNDYSVCTTLGVSAYSFDILNVWRDKVAYPDLVVAAKDQATWVDMAFRGLPYTLLVEDANAGVQLIQTLDHETRLPVVPIPAFQKNLKEMRVLDVTPLAKARKIRLLQGASWHKALMSEYTNYPNAEHDDIVDSSFIAIRYAAGVGMDAPATSHDYLKREDKDPPNPHKRKPPTPRYRTTAQRRSS